MRRAAASSDIGLASCDLRGRVSYDPQSEPLADGGVVRRVTRDEKATISAPTGPSSATMVAGSRSVGRAWPLKAPHGARSPVAGRVHAHAFAGISRGRRRADAPALRLRAFACVVDDELMVAAMRTDRGEDWAPRHFAEGELERAIAERRRIDPTNRVLDQVALCATSYGCFTAQNHFLARGEAALPVSPRCNARCVGCISEQDEESGFPAPQTRIVGEVSVDEIARAAIAHLERVPDGIVSFGQGCEGEPLLRATIIARAIERIRARITTGTVNCNTNGSLPESLRMLIDAGLDAVRISLNSFRSSVYAAYYRPIGYALDDVLASTQLAGERGLRVSLNLLTHPGVTDDPSELSAMETVLPAALPSR